MLLVSGVFHLLLGFLALLLASYRVPVRLEPVAVVSLIGGRDIPPELEKPAPPREIPPAAPPARKESAPVREKARKTPEKAPPKKKAPAAEGLRERVPPQKKALPDTSSVEERLRRMREQRAEADSVRKAVEEHRREAAARKAVRGIGERVARRIESPPENAGGFAGGSKGTVRVSPELLDYFRRLEEQVRESWVLPQAMVRDAGKLMVEVKIVIESDGRVSDTRIEKGSGNVYFDDSVRRAIRKASPLPIPPERLRGGEDHYEVGFRFHGAGGGG